MTVAVPERSERFLRALASPVEDEAALEAARQILEGSGGFIEELYPKLVVHRILSNATSHLERAGGDVDALSVSDETFRSTWPLSALFPSAARGSGGRVTLRTLRDLLRRHRQTLGEEVLLLLDALPEASFMALSGRALAAGYPGYHLRMEYDADLFAWDVDVGLAMLEVLRSKRRYGMHRARIFRLADGWHAEMYTFRTSGEGNELHVDLVVGAKVGRSRPIGPLPRRERARPVAWQGRTLLIPAPEDLLLASAVQFRRRSTLSLRDLNDARMVLEADRQTIDWEYLSAAASRFGVAPLLGRLLAEAERATGEELAPAVVRRRLQDEAGVVPAFGPKTAVTETATGRVVLPAFILPRRKGRRSVGALLRRARRVVTSKATRAAVTARVEAALFRLRVRLARGRSPASAMLLRVLRGLGRGSGSLCELRARPKPAGGGSCISRTAAGGRALPRGLDARERAVMRALVAALPDRPQEEMVRIRPAEEGQAWVAHRCRMFPYQVR